MKVALKVMNVTPDGTIAVPLPAVKREIKYATKLAGHARVHNSQTRVTPPQLVVV